MLEIETIPCLSDNYAFLAHDPRSGETALIDAPEPGPILERLDAKGWKLSHVLITHHHYDHVDGLAQVLAQHPAKVIGNAADTNRLPNLDLALNDGETFSIGGCQGVMIDVSGHTIGHVAFHFPAANVVFTADSLMAMGCGRVFEGTKLQMYASLQKIAALPPSTIVCSGHEYTQANAKFALSIDPDNPELRARVERISDTRAKGVPTVPSILAEELATNPFLRAHDVAIKAHLGMPGASDEDTFAEIRTRKDNF